MAKIENLLHVSAFFKCLNPHCMPKTASRLKVFTTVVRVGHFHLDQPVCIFYIAWTTIVSIYCLDLLPEVRNCKQSDATRNVTDIHYQDSSPTELNARLRIFMPPTLDKLKGQIAFGLSGRPSVRACARPSVRPLQNLLKNSFEISYMDSSSKNN